MKTVIIKCANCGKEIEKKKGEIDRQKRKGRDTFYCSRSCAGSASCKHLKDHDPFPVWKHYKNKPDEYSLFRSFIRSAKKREFESKKLIFEVDITCEYLKELWEKQNGKCALTNIDLILERNHLPFQASLDRIDCSKGYVQGNVRFICLIANYARNKWDDEAVFEFISRSNPTASTNLVYNDAER
jgi:hypothetical protein